MTPQACLGQTLKATTGVRADKGTCPCLKLVWVLGGHVILQGLSSRALVCTMLALVLESAAMLCLDVHVNGRLVFLGKVAVAALEAPVLCAQIVKRHFGE